MSIPNKSRQVVLAGRPQGRPQVSDFRLETVDTPTAGPGEILTRALWLSVDPYMRLNLNENAAAPLPLGQLMNGGTVSEVVVSNHSDFNVGDIVEGRTGWREFAVGVGQGLRKVDPTAEPLSIALGVLGMPGITAHTGLLQVGRAKAGETVVISAAGGAVGSIAGQIGKIVGCRVVGIANGAKKCAEVKSLGFDACVDYRAPDYAEKLKAACPDGIDLYFENVGGAVSQVVFQLLSNGARVAVCGFIGYSSLPDPPDGPDRLAGLYKLLVMKQLKISGFVGALAASPDARKELTAWVKEGRIVHPETVYEGLDQAPQAFADMFASRAGLGKVVVRVGSL